MPNVTYDPAKITIEDFPTVYPFDVLVDPYAPIDSETDTNSTNVSDNEDLSKEANIPGIPVLELISICIIATLGIITQKKRI
jgi:hypothetical protein